MKQKPVNIGESQAQPAYRHCTVISTGMPVSRTYVTGIPSAAIYSGRADAGNRRHLCFASKSTSRAWPRRYPPRAGRTSTRGACCSRPGSVEGEGDSFAPRPPRCPLAGSSPQPLPGVARRACDALGGRSSPTSALTVGRPKPSGHPPQGIYSSPTGNGLNPSEAHRSHKRPSPERDFCYCTGVQYSGPTGYRPRSIVPRATSRFARTARL